MEVIILYYTIGLLACIIGALPFGLVNLSVVDISINQSERNALSFSIGASIVEIIFALAAIILGQQFYNLLENNKLIEIGIILILIISAYYFFRKNYKENVAPNYKVPFMLKGILFNLISIQVLLYWFLAIAFIENIGSIHFNTLYLAVFVLGVGSGKMFTLLFYRLISRQVKKKASKISKKINVIIGSLLIFAAIFQIFKALT